MFRVGFQLRETAQCAADFAAAVEDFNGGSERHGAVWGFADFGDVAAVFEHAEGGAEGEVADDVEGEIVEPVEGVDGGVARGGVFLRFG